MNRLNVVHLLDDVAPGGVMQALAVFDLPELAERLACRILQINPEADAAPTLEADIIMTHFPPRWRALTFLAALKHRNPHAQLVHIEHSYTGGWEEQCVAHRFRFRTMLRIAYRLFDDVVAVSQGQAAWLNQVVGGLENRLSIIPPLSLVDSLEALPLPTWNGERPLVIGAYGRFTQMKGFDRLLKQFKTLPAERFELVLGGFGEQAQSLQALSYGLANVNFYGHVANRASFLAGCDIVVVPSHFEAYGLVATEARQAGRPIIVADVDGLPEQTCQGRAGIALDFSSESALSRALEALTPKAFARMSREGKLSVEGLQNQRVLAWKKLFRLSRWRQGVALAG